MEPWQQSQNVYFPGPNFFWLVSPVWFFYWTLKTSVSLFLKVASNITQLSAAEISCVARCEMTLPSSFFKIHLSMEHCHEHTKKRFQASSMLAHASKSHIMLNIFALLYCSVAYVTEHLRPTLLLHGLTNTSAYRIKVCNLQSEVLKKLPFSKWLFRFDFYLTRHTTCFKLLPSLLQQKRFYSIKMPAFNGTPHFLSPSLRHFECDAAFSLELSYISLEMGFSIFRWDRWHYHWRQHIGTKLQ